MFNTDRNIHPSGASSGQKTYGHGIGQEKDDHHSKTRPGTDEEHLPKHLESPLITPFQAVCDQHDKREGCHPAITEIYLGTAGEVDQHKNNQGKNYAQYDLDCGTVLGRGLYRGAFLVSRLVVIRSWISLH